MEFVVSTTAFRRKKIEEVIALAKDQNFAIEFSSGLPYRPDMQDVFKTCDVPRFPHNYFPSPQVPFVLNLGSLDSSIREKSLNHCLQGLDLAKAANAPFFSAHAGFCIDPQPRELGRPLVKRPMENRERNWQVFVETVKELVDHAKKLDVSFLIENNVVAPFNVFEGGQHPLLCTRLEELMRLVKKVSSKNFGLLIDTGHLKVSAVTENFSAEETVLALKPWIKAFHHSDNDGTEDNNLPLQKDYWFLKLMSEFPDCTHILEVHDQTIDQIQYQRDLLSKAI